MKKVFSGTNEVCHVFAQQSQTEGRAGNVFFEDTTKIYSYGRHYLLGEFITPDVCIVNDIGYSVSTSKHISMLLGAVSHKTVFNVTNIDIDIVENEIEYLKTKLGNARKLEIYINAIERAFNSLDKWVNFISRKKIDTKYKLTKSNAKYKRLKRFVDALLNDSEDIQTKLSEYNKRKAKQQKAKETRERKKKLKDFFSYEINTFRIGKEDYIRVSENGERIETSQGIKIDIEDARKLYKAIQLGIDIKGYNIGCYYTVNSLNGTLKVGCHSINKANMHEIGEQITK